MNDFNVDAMKFGILFNDRDGARKAISEERLILPLASPCCLNGAVEWISNSG